MNECKQLNIDKLSSNIPFCFPGSNSSASLNSSHLLSHLRGRRLGEEDVHQARRVCHHSWFRRQIDGGFRWCRHQWPDDEMKIRLESSREKESFWSNDTVHSQVKYLHLQFIKPVTAMTLKDHKSRLLFKVLKALYSPSSSSSSLIHHLLLFCSGERISFLSSSFLQEWDGSIGKEQNNQSRRHWGRRFQRLQRYQGLICIFSFFIFYIIETQVLVHFGTNLFVLNLPLSFLFDSERKDGVALENSLFRSSVEKGLLHSDWRKTYGEENKIKPIIGVRIWKLGQS